MFPPPTHRPCLVTSDLSVSWILNNTLGLHLGFDPNVLSGLNGFAQSRLMEAVYLLFTRTGQIEAKTLEVEPLRLLISIVESYLFVEQYTNMKFVKKLCECCGFV